MNIKIVRKTAQISGAVLLLAISLPAFTAASTRCQSSRVEVTVKDQDGVAISGAEVTLDGSPPVHRMTSASGVAVFDGISSTTGKLSVRAAGFASRDVDWRADAGS